ncbi:hypothetical protein DIPPA_50061 [Diplonema papillatum]|nr:hypothetical protein DIPPA_50061 [Diplonema papillatum]
MHISRGGPSSRKSQRTMGCFWCFCQRCKICYQSVSFCGALLIEPLSLRGPGSFENLGLGRDSVVVEVGILVRSRSALIRHAPLITPAILIHDHVVFVFRQRYGETLERSLSWACSVGESLRRFQKNWAQHQDPIKYAETGVSKSPFWSTASFFNRHNFDKPQPKNRQTSRSRRAYVIHCPHVLRGAWRLAVVVAPVLVVRLRPAGHFQT